MKTQTLHLIAVLLGIAGSLLAILAVAVYEGYLTTAQVGNFTADELGVLSALSVAGAIGTAYAENNL